MERLTKEQLVEMLLRHAAEDWAEERARLTAALRERMDECQCVTGTCGLCKSNAALLEQVKP